MCGFEMDYTSCCGRHIKELAKPWIKEPFCETCQRCKRCCWTKDNFKCPTRDTKKRYEKKTEKPCKVAFLA